MMFWKSAAAACLAVPLAAPAASGAPPLRVHPENPRLLEFRGEPVVLRAYAEHYGSVIHPDFDYERYLDAMEKEGVNLTRVVLLGFRTHDKIGQKPLSPAADRFLQPWQRMPAAGSALDGQGKWDFSAWNEAYFARLRNFAEASAKRGVVVEFCFFNTIYNNEPAFWNNSPFHPANNVQGYGPASQFDAMRGTDANLTAVQEAAVRRIVRELNGFDHIYFEIQNEPFWNEPGVGDSAEAAFHNTMLGIIRDEESGLPNRHLVAHNYPNQVAALSADFDLINCHYPFDVPGLPWVIGGETLLASEYHRAKPLSLDESSAYNGLSARLEAWMFALGGGAVYNGLDSGVFDPAAALVYPLSNPAGDTEPGISIRRTLRNLGTFTDSLPLSALRRDTSWITGGLPSGARVQGMSVPGQQYVAYLHHGAIPTTSYSTVYNPIDTSNHAVSLQVTLDAGTWRAVWTRPDDLAVLHTENITHGGGTRTLQNVVYQADVALRVERTGAADTTPPPPPRSLAAGAPQGGAVSLSWNPAPAADLASYRVYHAAAPGVEILPANLIAELPAPQSGHVHASVAMDAPHHYVVTAVDQNGNESAASREALSRVSSRPFGGAPWPVPGTVECENFDSGGQGVAYQDLTDGNAGGVYRPAEDVDLAAATDSGGGHHVESLGAGEWLDFTLHVDKTDRYDLDLRCAVAEAGNELRVLVDGVPAAGPIGLPVSGSGVWQTFRIPDLLLNEGPRVLRLMVAVTGPSADAGAFNRFTLTPQSRPGPNAIAGDDLTVTDGDWSLAETVTLNASASIAGAQPIVSWSWRRQGVEFATGPNPAVSFATGSHRIQLVTTDSTGLSDSDDLVVKVVSPGFVNGGFEPDFSAWTTSGNVVRSSAHAATQGSWVLVFNDDNTSPTGILRQTFPTTPGQIYRLRFDMGVKAFNTAQQSLGLEVSGNTPLLNRIYAMSGVGGGSLVWSAKNETFTADSAWTTLIFRDLSTTTASIDLMLDNVRITRVLANGILPETPLIEPVTGGWKLRVSSPDSGIYQLQRSDNLAGWTVVEQREVAAPGWIEFTDLTVPAGARVFYRVGLVQPP